MEKQEGNEWLKILQEDAEAGREAILQNYDSKSRNEVIGRGAGGDETLRIDLASESAIHKSLDRSLGRDYIFLSEEMGEVGKKKGAPVVICDPLDGSHNARVGVPLFAVSLSLLGRGSKSRRFADMEAAVITSIATKDEFSALRQRGSFHNSEKLSATPSTRKRFETLLVECGDPEYLKSLLRNFSSESVYKTRLLGSAALSLSFLASGVADGLIFAQPGGARSIDSPAGYLIAKEAGCVFSDLDGKSVDKIGIGFDSRVDLLGARSRKLHGILLSMLEGVKFSSREK